MNLASYLMANGLDRLMVFALCMAALFLLDKITPRIDYTHELKEDNLACGIALAGLFVGLGLAIGGIR